VWTTDSDDGLKTLIARAASGDAVWFMATINRIADILAADGAPDPVGVRRSKAIGILAQPPWLCSCSPLIGVMRSLRTCPSSHRRTTRPRSPNTIR
jgi:hypothetical protein